VGGAGTWSPPLSSTASTPPLPPAAVSTALGCSAPGAARGAAPPVSAAAAALLLSAPGPLPTPAARCGAAAPRLRPAPLGGRLPLARLLRGRVTRAPPAWTRRGSR